MRGKYFMSSTVPQAHNLSRLPSAINEELPVLNKLHHKIQDKQYMATCSRCITLKNSHSNPQPWFNTAENPLMSLNFGW